METTQPSAPARPRRIEDMGDKIGPWMFALIFVLIYLATVWLDDIFFIGFAAILLGILFGSSGVLAGLKSEGALRRRMLACGGTLMLLGALGTYYAYYRYGAQLESPRTVVIDSYWGQGGSQFIRLGEQIYAVYDFSSWPPTVGQSYCVQFRRPRIRAASVARLRAGECDQAAAHIVTP